SEEMESLRSGKCILAPRSGSHCWSTPSEPGLSGEGRARTPTGQGIGTNGDSRWEADERYPPPVIRAPDAAVARSTGRFGVTGPRRGRRLSMLVAVKRIVLDGPRLLLPVLPI